MQNGLKQRLGTSASAVSAGAGALVAGILAGASRIRGGKAVHPHGVVYSARLRIDGSDEAPPGSGLLSRRNDLPAIVRFSRSAGLPRPLPDLLGMAIRVLDAYGEDEHQDFLLVSSVDLPILHHIFLPAGDVQQRLYSSSLPYRSGDETFLVGVRPDPASPRPDGSDEFERLDKAAESGRLCFELSVAPLLGRFRRVGELAIETRLPPDADALRFNPFNTGADLEPVGFLNRWRRAAYPLSQEAWRRSGGRDRAQDRAEALIGSRADEERAAARRSEPAARTQPIR